LGLLQKNIHKLTPYLSWVTGIVLIFITSYTLQLYNSTEKIIGSSPEFIERSDGYHELAYAYNFSNLKVADMEAGLMYYSLANQRLDAIIGYSTNGRIDAYNLQALKDDKNYFPPYFVAPLAREAVISKHPELLQIFQKLKISEAEMIRMNYLVEGKKLEPRKVAQDFMKKKGFKTQRYYTGSAADVVIGGKKFTEHFILPEIFKILIENSSSLKVKLKLGLGGTQIAFEALKAGEIDIYPEYTGTALFVLLKTPAAQAKPLGNDRQKVYDYVRLEMQKRYNLLWLNPLGFNNTYALLMRKQQARLLGIKTVSDFSAYLKNMPN
jgi:osmoprotectant transport system permease protein